MDADKQEQELLNKALSEWKEQGLLSAEKTDELRNSIKPKGTQQIAQYFFFIAISCILLAFGAIFIDDKLLEKVKTYFAFSNLAIAGLMLALSIVWFWYIIRKRQSKPGTISYEIYMIIGALSALCTLTYICKDTGFGPNYTGFLFVTFLLLFTLSSLFRSRALWIAGILALMGWYGAVSTLYATDDRFLGMNYPMRFSVFGLLLLGCSFLLKKIHLASFAQRITFVTSLIILFTGLWGVSIFGNFSHLEEWSRVRQVHVLAYAFVFGIAAVISFFAGIKFKDDFARDMGVLFLLVNLYTRYFEYFWDSVNKGIFFLILAVSFFLVGKWIEKKKRTNGKVLS